MSEDRKWLWAARLMTVLALLTAFKGVSEVWVGTAFVMVAIMYATSALLKALSPNPQQARRDE